MPPRQGQSQFISPVAGLNAPSLDASSSSPAGSEAGGVDGGPVSDCSAVEDDALSGVPLSSEAIDARIDLFLLLLS